MADTYTLQLHTYDEANATVTDNRILNHKWEPVCQVIHLHGDGERATRTRRSAQRWSLTIETISPHVVVLGDFTRPVFDALEKVLPRMRATHGVSPVLMPRWSDNGLEILRREAIPGSDYRRFLTNPVAYIRKHYPTRNPVIVTTRQCTPNHTDIRDIVREGTVAEGVTVPTGEWGNLQCFIRIGRVQAGPRLAMTFHHALRLIPVIDQETRRHRETPPGTTYRRPGKVGTFVTGGFPLSPIELKSMVERFGHGTFRSLRAVQVPNRETASRLQSVTPDIRLRSQITDRYLDPARRSSCIRDEALYREITARTNPISVARLRLAASIT